MLQTLANLVFELARFIGAIWSKTWRKVFRTRKTFFVSLGVLTFAGLIWAIASSAMNPGTDRPTVEPTATDRPVTYTEVKVKYADQTGSTPGLQEGSAQPATGDTPQVEAKKPEFNKDSAESVAKGVVQSYVTRPNQAWSEWEQWVKPHIQGELLMQLQGTIASGSAAHDYPVTVATIHVEDAAATAQRDTPIRWSRTLRIETVGKSGSGEIKFNVAAALGDEGWIVTEMIQVED